MNYVEIKNNSHINIMTLIMSSDNVSHWLVKEQHQFVNITEKVLYDIRITNNNTYYYL